MNRTISLVPVSPGMASYRALHGSGETLRVGSGRVRPSGRVGSGHLARPPTRRVRYFEALLTRPGPIRETLKTSRPERRIGLYERWNSTGGMNRKHAKYKTLIISARPRTKFQAVFFSTTGRRGAHADRYTPSDGCVRMRKGLGLFYFSRTQFSLCVWSPPLACARESSPEIPDSFQHGSFCVIFGAGGGDARYVACRQLRRRDEREARTKTKKGTKYSYV